MFYTHKAGGGLTKQARAQELLVDTRLGEDNAVALVGESELSCLRAEAAERVAEPAKVRAQVIEGSNAGMSTRIRGGRGTTVVRREANVVEGGGVVVRVS